MRSEFAHQIDGRDLISGEKRVYTSTVGPLFSQSVARPPRSQTKKSYGVYHFPGKTRDKGIHHRSGKKGIHHRASDPEKEKKGGSPRWWCMFFSSLYLRKMPLKPQEWPSGLQIWAFSALKLRSLRGWEGPFRLGA